MSANRFMQPVKANYFQTYVSQYVPQPFELMQRAVDNAQKHYDAVAKNIEAQQAFLGQLSTHSGADTRALQQYQNLYQQELDQIMNSGDLRFKEDQVRTLAKKLGEDYRYGPLGSYVASGKAEQAHLKWLEETESKELGKGGLSEEARAYEEDLRRRWQETGYGEDFKKAVLTRTYRGSADLQEDAMNYGKEMKASTIQDISGRFGGEAVQGIYQFMDRNYKGLGFNEVQAGTTLALLNDSDDRRELEMRARVNKAGRTGERVSEVEITNEDLMAEAVKAVLPTAEAYSFTEGDTKTQFQNKPDMGAGSSFDPSFSYTFAGSSANSRTMDPEKLRLSISSTVDELVKTQKEVADLLAKGDSVTASELRTLELKRDKLRKLDNQKRAQKRTLVGAATKGGYDWDKEYENFLIQDYQVDNNLYTIPSKEEIEELKKNPPFDIEQFKDMVTEGAYFMKTPRGVDYADKAFQDRNVDFNMLQDYSNRFINASESEEAKNYAVESVLMSGGSKTYLKELTAKVSDFVEKGAVEVLDIYGSQFDVNTWAEEVDLDRSKPIETFMEATYIDGKPTFQVAGVDTDGNKVTKRITVEDPNSEIATSIRQVGWDMMEHAQGEPKKKAQTFNEGAYIYGSSNFPDLARVKINVLPLNETYRHVLPDGRTTVEITPTYTKGVKQYEATIGGYPIVEGGGVVYQKPEDIFAALGESIYKETKAANK